jgi:hypothetical protein
MSVYIARYTCRAGHENKKNLSPQHQLLLKSITLQRAHHTNQLSFATTDCVIFTDTSRPDINVFDKPIHNLIHALLTF